MAGEITNILLVILLKWTSLSAPQLLTMASRRKDWKRISAESSLMSPALSAISQQDSDIASFLVEIIQSGNTEWPAQLTRVCAHAHTHTHARARARGRTVNDVIIQT